MRQRCRPPSTPFTVNILLLHFGTTMLTSILDTGSCNLPAANGCTGLSLELFPVMILHRRWFKQDHPGTYSREINRLSQTPREPHCLPNTFAVSRAPPVHRSPYRGSGGCRQHRSALRVALGGKPRQHHMCPLHPFGMTGVPATRVYFVSAYRKAGSRQRLSPKQAPSLDALDIGHWSNKRGWVPLVI